MVTRLRNRVESYGGIRTHNNTHVVETQSANSLQDSIQDEVAPGDCRPLVIDQRSKSGGQMYGRQLSNLTGYDYNGFVCSWQFGNSDSTNHLSMPTYANSDLALEVIKRTNPSRASVDLMTDLVELKDIPGLVKDYWDIGNRELFGAISKKAFRVLTDVAKVNLMYQFGIAPLIGDFKKMLEFQKRVNERVAELERMMSSRGLRRTIELRADSATATYGVTLNSQGGGIASTAVKRTSQNIRGHIRWYPMSNFVRANHDIRADALNVVNGNMIDFETIYNLLPWSWLIDYFTNLGDFISAGRNTVEARHDSVIIMRDTKTSVSVNGSQTNDGRVKCTPIENRRRTYTRDPATPQLSAHLDFLTVSQTSILGSLSVIKGPKLTRF